VVYYCAGLITLLLADRADQESPSQASRLPPLSLSHFSFPRRNCVALFYRKLRELRRLAVYCWSCSKPPAVFEHLGPKTQTEPVATCCRLTERVWLKYLDLIGNRMPAKDSREFLIMKMLCIAELTSTAIRLNMSWGLSHPGMSLFRDRYEQTLRFSWLVRNPDPQAFSKYDRTKFATMGDLARSVSAETRANFEKLLGPIPPWASEPLSKDQRKFFEEWSNLDLRSMGKKARRISAACRRASR
jgi:hypothetical protein